MNSRTFLPPPPSPLPEEKPTTTEGHFRTNKHRLSKQTSKRNNSKNLQPHILTCLKLYQLQIHKFCPDTTRNLTASQKTYTPLASTSKTFDTRARGRVNQLSHQSYWYADIFSVCVCVCVCVLSLIYIWRCRRDVLCRSRWSPYN